ncbi:hypothetical protein AAMO2058_001360800 [Amorphochlora amoebiformis]
MSTVGLEEPSGERGGGMLYKSFTVCKANKFRIEGRFTVDKVIGTGAYGVVCRGKDLATRQEVAVKKIFPLDHFVLLRRALREIRALRCLSHAHVMASTRVMYPDKDLSAIYVVMTKMETDLGNIIASNQLLSDRHVQFFTYQLLCGLQYIHSSGLIHCDIKPRNLLVNSDCSLKIADFGLIRPAYSSHSGEGKLVKKELDSKIRESAHKEADSKASGDIMTLWYRAPEAIQKNKKDGIIGRFYPSVDLWGTGCVLGELYSRKPLYPGDTAEDVMRLIQAQAETMQKEGKKAETMQKKGKKGTNAYKFWKDDADRFEGEISVESCKLGQALLTIDHKNRLTAKDALSLPMFSTYRNPTSERIWDGPLLSSGMLMRSSTLEEISKEVLKEIQLNYPPITQREVQEYENRNDISKELSGLFL